MDAKNVPSRAKNVRCPKDIYLMAEEVLGLHGSGSTILMPGLDYDSYVFLG